MFGPRRLFVAAALLTVAVPVAAQRRSSAAPAAPATFDSSLYNALEWREIGPFRGGRVTAVAGHAAQPLTFYFGGTGGGVWKTTDGGLTWTPISDKVFRAGSIGAIEVAPSDPNVIYVGTGESPIRGNVSPGNGVYKSTDEGKTWTHVGLPNSGQIGAIRVHPTNADLVYVAVLGHAFGPNPDRGVFRSKDGGKTWEKVLFRSDSAGAVDLAMDPANPRILYAAFWQARRGPWYMSSGGAGSGLFKSTDGGDTWKEITRNEGLPKGVIGKIGVTVSANHDRVWAIVEADSGGVFRSDDGGETWRRTNDERNLRQRAWYYSHIHADPKDPETVYVLNTSLYRSVDGGRTFTQLRAPHGDHHGLWIAPNDPARMINSNDGGATISYNGGATWTSQGNQPTAQFYHVIATTHVPYRVCGSQQDNSTVCIASRTDGGTIGEKDWYEVGGGESGWIAARADDPDIVYAGSYSYLSRLDVRTGQQRNVFPWPDNPMGWGAGDLKYRFQWTFPVVLSPLNPNALYAGANVIFRTTNEGQSWEAISGDLTRNDKSKEGPSGGPITKDNTSVEYYNTVFVIAPSSKDSGLIWAGSDDGLVHVTRDGGKTWTNVTPPARDLPDWSLISSIEPSPHDAGTAYIAATRYKLDDFKPYIFKTSDYGKTWRPITAGIPDSHFIRVVREDPARRGLLYAGGEFGVYVSFDDGGSWQSLQRNLPVVPIHDLVVKDNDLVAATHGRAFWILDDLTPLQQLADSLARATRFVYTPRAAYRMGLGGGFGGGGGGGGPANAGRNPPGGAVVFFYLKSAPDSATNVSLDFLDSRDSLVRRFTPKPRAPSTDSLKVRAGMNRFVWNLRYPDASRFQGMIYWAGGTAGPVAVPGSYKVRLTVGDWSQTRLFAVRPDPRVKTTPEEYQRQFDLLMKISGRVSAANDAVRRIREVHEQLDGAATRAKGLPGDGGKRIAQQADSIKGRLAAVEEAIYQVKNRSSQDPLNYPIRLNNKIAALAGVVAGTDAAPTAQAVQVFDELSAALQVQLDRLKAVLDADIPAFNKLVKESDVPAIILR
ncbi:MAG: glycosyl hydrolase [Gemmatimonadetes bacterium]|nr:MAG: glycosyl hydrolase [Gemmatimonadota bacterium]